MQYFIEIYIFKQLLEPNEKHDTILTLICELGLIINDRRDKCKHSDKNYQSSEDYVKVNTL